MLVFGNRFMIIDPNNEVSYSYLSLAFPFLYSVIHKIVNSELFRYLYTFFVQQMLRVGHVSQYTLNSRRCINVTMEQFFDLNFCFGINAPFFFHLVAIFMRMLLVIIPNRNGHVFFVIKNIAFFFAMAVNTTPVNVFTSFNT